MGRFVLSLLPILFFIVALIWRPKKLTTGAALSLILVSVIALFSWQMRIESYYGSLLKGLLVALDILVIILGALLFLHLQKAKGYLGQMIDSLSIISSDLRTQVIIVAWFMGSFLESICGFGTTAVLVTPIMVRMGVDPLTAICLALFANTPAVIFGAIGTPLGVGMQGLISTDLIQVSALVGAGLAVLIPVSMMAILAKGKEQKPSYWINMIPQALLAGVLFGAFLIIGALLGNEFPSMIASALGLVGFLILQRYKLFLPKDFIKQKPKALTQGWQLGLYPYLAVLVLLVIAKYTLPETIIKLPGSINYSLRLFNPGYVLILVSAAMLLIFPKLNKTLMPFWKREKIRFAKVALAMCLIVAMVQIWQSSGNNQSDLPSMASYFIKYLQTPFWPILAPFVGALGAMVGGSATVSNLIFSGVQANMASSLGISVVVILAMQIVGATAGNALAFTNLLAAQTAIGRQNLERKIYIRLWPWIVGYLLVSAMVGYLLLV